MAKAYEDTSVPKARSQEQIEKMLRKFGVQAIRFTSFPSYATLEFVRKEKDGRLSPYRIVVKPKSQSYARSPEKKLDQAERQVWRVTFWWLKSKIEAIDFGLVEFQEDFLPYLMITNSQGRTDTVGRMITERLDGLMTSPGDPFGGLCLALPTGEGKGEDSEPI